MLFLYGTVYNNANTVIDTLNSIKDLNYSFIYITDNFSNDGTYEILKKYSNEYRIKIFRVKSTRGFGRGFSLNKALEESDNNVVFMFIDFDTIYSDDSISFINSKINTIDDNSIYNNFLSTRKANEIVGWANLNYGEDWERLAHFRKLNYKIYITNFNDVNQETSGYREIRYAHGMRLFIRGFKNAIDSQRGFCFKSFRAYYKKQRMKKYKPMYYLAFLLANIIGCYCYSEELDNKTYALEPDK